MLLVECCFEGMYSKSLHVVCFLVFCFLCVCCCVSLTGEVVRVLTLFIFKAPNYMLARTLTDRVV